MSHFAPIVPVGEYAVNYQMWNYGYPYMGVQAPYPTTAYHNVNPNVNIPNAQPSNPPIANISSKKVLPILDPTTRIPLHIDNPQPVHSNPVINTSPSITPSSPPLTPTPMVHQPPPITVPIFVTTPNFAQTHSYNSKNNFNNNNNQNHNGSGTRKFRRPLPATSNILSPLQQPPTNEEDQRDLSPGYSDESTPRALERPKERPNRYVYSIEELRSLSNQASTPPPELMKYDCFLSQSERRNKSKHGSKETTPEKHDLSLKNRAEDPFAHHQIKDDKELIIKTTRNILNKITQESFEKLFEELYNEVGNLIKDDTDTSKVESMVDTIVEVALDQNSFCQLYSELCQRFYLKLKEGIEDPDEQTTATHFRRILLNRVQCRFEEGSKHEPLESTDEVIIANEALFRRRTLGNILFISELFRQTSQSFVSEKIMHAIIRILLLDTDHTDKSHQDMLEGLLKLLDNVGSRLDRPAAKKHMDKYFAKLNDIAQNHPTTRIRLLVQNIIELRRDRWIPRRVGKPNENETITQVPNNSIITSLPTITITQPNATDTKLSIPNNAPSLVLAVTSPSPRNNIEPIQTVVVDSIANNIAAVDQRLNNGSDEKIASKASTLLEEYCLNHVYENPAEVFESEVQIDNRHDVLVEMIMLTISQNKRNLERNKIAELMKLYCESNVLKLDEILNVFIMTIKRCCSEQLWEDVPCLWRNVAQVITNCLKEKLFTINSICTLCDNIPNYEECPRLVPKFLQEIALDLKGNNLSEMITGKDAKKLLSVAQKRLPVSLPFPNMDGLDGLLAALNTLNK